MVVVVGFPNFPMRWECPSLSKKPRAPGPAVAVTRQPCHGPPMPPKPTRVRLKSIKTTLMFSHLLVNNYRGSDLESRNCAKDTAGTKFSAVFLPQSLLAPNMKQSPHHPAPFASDHETWLQTALIKNTTEKPGTLKTRHEEKPNRKKKKKKK